MKDKPRMVGLAGLAALTVALLACGDDSGPNVVDVRVDDTSIDIPNSIAPGFTTFQILGESDGDNHLLFVLANEGVTQEAMEAGIHANDGSGDDLVTIVGGNGGMPKGTSADVTFELSQGTYGVVLFSDEGDLAADSYFSVGDGDDETSPPNSDGVIEMGPGLTFSLPSDFNGKGTFELKNADNQIHEAAFILLEHGSTMDDVSAWANSGFEGRPPFAPAGGFGALDGGRRGWIGADLAPGNYAIICWIPGPEGLPHWLNGMSARFTVK